MSRIDYVREYRGVKLFRSEEAWIKKGNKYILNPDIDFLGKVESTMPNLIISTKANSKPSYKGDIHHLSINTKRQIIKYFYDDKGKRNQRTVAYFGNLKNPKK